MQACQTQLLGFLEKYIFQALITCGYFLEKASACPDVQKIGYELSTWLLL